VSGLLGGCCYRARGGRPFNDFCAGLDHVSLALPDVSALVEDWQSRLADRGVSSDLRRSEWGHHLNFRGLYNIALELVVLEPHADVRDVLARV
jgi:hypothetical protein